ncbi:hypothetical protein B0H14DRAFT_2831818, partial [Mycena olivaceomarginata]
MTQVAVNDRYREIKSCKLKKPQHLFLLTAMSTTGRLRAKIVDSERELEECLGMVQQWRHDHSILAFPNEIMEEIFLRCLPVYSDSIYSDNYWSNASSSNPLRAPMLLLHVCREWRSIALSTPALWDHLHLKHDLPDVFFEGSDLEKFLRDWLARASARPLSLFLEGETYGRRGLTSYHPQSTFFARPVPQINDIAQMWQYPEDALDFPLLRNLSLISPDEYMGNVALEGYPIQIFSVASQLQELELDAVAPSLFAIPWEALVVFTGRYLRHDDCIDVLRQASFSFLGDCTIFRWLTLPALEKLEVDMDGMDESLLPFINPIGISLSAMAALTDLTLVDLSRSNEYLDEFFRHFDGTNHPRFLPQLRVAGIHRLSAPTQDGRARLRSFRQIWADGTPLQFNFEQGVGLALA